MLQHLSLLFLITQSLALPLTCLGDEGVLVGMIAAASLARLGALLASCSELSNICMKASPAYAAGQLFKSVVLMREVKATPGAVNT
jgi:hypothetical protein